MYKNINTLKKNIKEEKISIPELTDKESTKHDKIFRKKKDEFTKKKYTPLKINKKKSNTKDRIIINNDLSPSNVFFYKNKYNYFENYGYINLNAKIKINLDSKVSYEYLVSNIHLNNQITYSPVIYSVNDTIIKYYKPKDVNFSILWEKESFFSDYKPFGKIDHNNFSTFTTVYLLNNEEARNYQLLLKILSNIGSNDYAMQTVFGDRWNNFVQSFNFFAQTIQEIGANDDNCTFYIKNNNGNTIIVNNNYILIRCDNHWNLKYVKYLKRKNSFECEIRLIKQQIIYFFFPDKSTVSQLCNHYYNNNKHLKYFKTKVYNSNQYVFEILPSNNDTETTIYMASEFDPLKSIKIKCSIVVEESSVTENETFFNFKNSHIYKDILKNNESFRLVGNKLSDYRKPVVAKNEKQATHIIDAMETFTINTSRGGSQQLHFFLSQCSRGGFSDYDIDRFSSILKRLNATYIIVWEFHKLNQPAETVYQYLFKKVAANINCKYIHYIITSQKKFNKIKIPYYHLGISNSNFLYFDNSNKLVSQNDSVWMNSFERENNHSRYYFVTKNQKKIQKNILRMQFVLISHQIRTHNSFHSNIGKIWKYSNNKFSISKLYPTYSNTNLDYQITKDRLLIHDNSESNFYKAFIWSKTNIPDSLTQIKFVLMPTFNSTSLPMTFGFEKEYFKETKLFYYNGGLKPIRYPNVCDKILYDRNGFAYIQYCGENKIICSEKLPNLIINCATKNFSFSS